MKAVCFSNLYYPHEVGGAEMSMRLLCAALAARGHSVTVLSVAPDGVPGRRTVDGVEVRTVQPGPTPWPFVARGRSTVEKALFHLVDAFNPVIEARLERAFADLDPDVVLCGNLLGMSSAPWRIAHRRGVPVLHYLHDYQLLCPKGMIGRNGPCERRCGPCRAACATKKSASRIPDTVLANSDYVLKRHLDEGYFGRARISAILPPSYDGPMRAQPRTPAAGGPLVLGYLGRINPEKGLARLLETLQRGDAPDWRLKVAGTFKSEAYRRELAPLLADPRVEYLGHVVPDALLGAIDVAVLPSLWPEPFGRTICEAYAFGVPVIGSCRGGIPENIAHGVTGFIYDPDRPETLTAALRQAAAGPEVYAALSRACLERARSYRTDLLADRFEALLHRTIAEGRPDSAEAPAPQEPDARPRARSL